MGRMKIEIENGEIIEMSMDEASIISPGELMKLTKEQKIISQEFIEGEDL